MRDRTGDSPASRPSLVAGGLIALVLLSAGCATTTTATAPQQLSSRFGWLAGLAGYCWHQNDFGATVCYWFGSPENLYWFSRNREELLGCGRFVMATADTRRGFIHSWDDDSVDPAMIFTLAGDALVTDENSESPRGTTKRISRNSFSIQDRPGTPALILTRKDPLSEADLGVSQCLKWEVERRFESNEAVENSCPDHAAEELELQRPVEVLTCVARGLTAWPDTRTWMAG